MSGIIEDFQEPSRGAILLDCQDCPFELNKADMVVSTKKNLTDFGDPLAYNNNKLIFTGGWISYFTPNVNARNNTITFFSDNSGALHTVSLTEGYYTVPNLMTALQTALNTLTGASGLTFTILIRNALQPGIYDITAAGGNFYFDLNCSMVVYGESLVNLPKEQILSAAKIIGYANGIYTKYIDFCSTDLSRYKRIDVRNTNYNINVVYRYYIKDHFAPYSERFEHTNDLSPLVLAWINSNSLNQAQMQLRDQYGQILYVPTGAQGSSDGFLWNLDIMTE